MADPTRRDEADRSSHPAPRPVGVVDVGSNTGRVAVLRVSPQGHLEVLEEGGAPLRLARDVGAGGKVSEAAMKRTVAVLRDFAAIARRAGAGRPVAVATAAIRNAANGPELIERIRREGGLEVRIIDGLEEARYGFLGAVYGLAIDHGLTMDIGGGSIELSRFRDRAMVAGWSLPLGALLMSDRFLESDPPSPREIEALQAHVGEALKGIELAPLRDDERLIGTGGTIRNLAKIDRHARAYPILRLHGYVLTRRRLQDLTQLLTSRTLSRRRAVPGLNADRADSVVGGGLVALTVMETVEAPELVVSGQGLREGIAYDRVFEAAPAGEAIRRSSIRALAARFATWDPGRARRRAAVAGSLLEAAEPEAGSSARERLEQAATLLDIGRSVDYYRRHLHTAQIVVAADLVGFTHRKLAFLAAVIRKAGDPGASIAAYRPLLGPDDRSPVARAAAILTLSEEVERRLPPSHLGAVSCRAERRSVVVTAPLFDPWEQDALAGMFRKAFGKRLVFEPPPSS